MVGEIGRDRLGVFRGQAGSDENDPRHALPAASIDLAARAADGFREHAARFGQDHAERLEIAGRGAVCGGDGRNGRQVREFERVLDVVDMRDAARKELECEGKRDARKQAGGKRDQNDLLALGPGGRCGHGGVLDDAGVGELQVLRFRGLLVAGE